MFAGADPGQNGGWAILDSNGKLFQAGRYEDWHRLILFLEDVHFAMVEAQQAWGSDSKAQSFSRAKLFENFGWWRGLFEGHGIKVETVLPRTWKAQFKLNLSPKRLSPVERSLTDKVKATMSLELARRLWPQAPLKYQKDNGVADALLIAEFGRIRNR